MTNAVVFLMTTVPAGGIKSTKSAEKGWDSVSVHVSFKRSVWLFKTSKTARYRRVVKESGCTMS